MLEAFDGFLEKQIIRQPDIIQYGMLEEASSMVIFGETFTWKSWLAMHMAAAVSSGSDWLIYPTNEVKVAIINTELTYTQYQDRWKAYAKVTGVKRENLFIYNPTLARIGSGNQMALIRQDIMKMGIKLLIIDNFYSSMAGYAANNEALREFQDQLDHVRLIEKCAVVMIHHSKQPSLDNRGQPMNIGMYEMFGGTFLPNWANNIVEVKREKQKDCVSIINHKYRQMTSVPWDGMYHWNREKLEFEFLI